MFNDEEKSAMEQRRTISVLCIVSNILEKLFRIVR